MTTAHLILNQATTTKRTTEARAHLWRCAECERGTVAPCVDSRRLPISLAADRHAYQTGHVVEIVTMTQTAERYTPCGHEAVRS